MDKDTIKEEELRGMFERLDHEVDLLYQALEARGTDVDEEYSDKVMRSQLESIGEVTEAMTEHIGEGEALSITTPSQLNPDDD